jgi:hypothetical protein
VSKRETASLPSFSLGFLFAAATLSARQMTMSQASPRNSRECRPLALDGAVEKRAQAKKKKKKNCLPRDGGDDERAKKLGDDVDDALVRLSFSFLFAPHLCQLAHPDLDRALVRRSHGAGGER